jgi:hypothetical protein
LRTPPHSSLVEEQHVTGSANICLVFPNGNTETSIEIDRRAVLNDPTGLDQLGVNQIARTLFSVLV